MSNKSIPPAILLFIVCLAPMISVLAQSQATTGNIEGRVLDPKDAAVPGATITATNQQTGLAKTTSSDSEVNYRRTLLPPGQYTVRANGQGFSPAETLDVTVTVGGKSTLDVKLSVGAASETVTIKEEPPVV